MKRPLSFDDFWGYGANVGVFIFTAIGAVAGITPAFVTPLVAAMLVAVTHFYIEQSRKLTRVDISRAGSVIETVYADGSIDVLGVVGEANGDAFGGPKNYGGHIDLRISK